MLTYYMWTTKFYSKKIIKKYYSEILPYDLKKYSYKQRLVFCILFSIFSIPIDIIFCIPEMIVYIVSTFIDM